MMTLLELLVSIAAGFSGGVLSVMYLDWRGIL